MVVGGSYVGKTSFVRMFVQNIFPSYYEPTLEDCYRKQYMTVDAQSCLLDITDTSGLYQVYGFLLESEMRHGDAFICMFAVNDRMSHELTGDLIKKLKLIKPEAPIVLVGNKCDIPQQSRQVDSSPFQHNMASLC